MKTYKPISVLLAVGLIIKADNQKVIEPEERLDKFRERRA
jgi:hypothetical protein